MLFTKDNLRRVIRHSPDLSMEGLMLLIDSSDDAEHTGYCKDCAFAKNNMPIDKNHTGMVACKRYMKYKNLFGFCDEFTADSGVAVSEADTVKKTKKKEITENAAE